MRLVINQVLPLVVLPYLLKVLHPDPFGRMMMAQAIGWYAVVLVEYGFNLTGVRAVALSRDDPGRLHSLVVGICITRLLIALAVAIALAAAIMLDIVDGEMALLLIAGFASALGAALQPLWLFQGLELFPLMSVVQLGARLVCLGSIFFVVRTSSDLLLAQWLFSAPFLICGLVLVPIAHRLSRSDTPLKPRAMLTQVRHHLKDGWDIFLSQVATTLFTSTNTLVLGTMLGPAPAGNYAIADKLVRGVAMLTTPVTDAVYPRIVTTLRENRAVALAFARRILWPGVGALAAVGVAIILASGTIASVMGPPSGRHEIALAMAIMAFNPMAVYANNIFGTQILLGLGHKSTFRNIVLVSGATVPVACFALAHAIGATAAPAGATMGEVVILTLMLLASRRAVGEFWMFGSRAQRGAAADSLASRSQ